MTDEQTRLRERIDQLARMLAYFEHLGSLSAALRMQLKSESTQPKKTETCD